MIAVDAHTHCCNFAFGVEWAPHTTQLPFVRSKNAFGVAQTQSCWSFEGTESAGHAVHTPSIFASCEFLHLH